MKKIIGLISLLLVLWTCKNEGETNAFDDHLVLNQYLKIKKYEQICEGSPKKLYVELNEEQKVKGIKWKIEEPQPMHYMVSVDGAPYSTIPYNALKAFPNKDWYRFDLLPSNLNKVCIIAVCIEYQNGVLMPFSGEETCHYFKPESQLEDLRMDVVIK